MNILHKKTKKNIFQTILVVIILLSVTLLPVTELGAEQRLPFARKTFIGKEAPAFTAENLSGENVSLSSFKGKPVILNFWATWCPYCRKERSYLNSLHREYKDKGLVIISVSTDRSVKTVKRFLKKIPMDFLILHDSEEKAGEIYGVYSLPTTYLIDRDGVVRNKFMGMRNWTDSQTKELIEKLLKE